MRAYRDSPSGMAPQALAPALRPAPGSLQATGRRRPGSAPYALAAEPCRARAHREERPTSPLRLSTARQVASRPLRKSAEPSLVGGAHEVEKSQYLSEAPRRKPTFCQRGAKVSKAFRHEHRV